MGGSKALRHYAHKVTGWLTLPAALPSHQFRTEGSRRAGNSAALMVLLVCV